MALTEIVFMPGADYQDACDAIREGTGGTDLIKSGDMGAAIRGLLPEACAVTVTINNHAGGEVYITYTNVNLELVMLTEAIPSTSASAQKKYTDVLKNSILNIDSSMEINNGYVSGSVKQLGTRATYSISGVCKIYIS